MYDLYNYYKSLPDYLSVEEVRKHIQNLLEVFEDNRTDMGDFIKSLKQLSDRQWHTYTLLDSELRSKIDTIISSIMMQKDFYHIDLLLFRNVLSTIGNLGLTKSYNLLRTSVYESADSEKKHEIKRLVDQIEKFSNGDVEDLYSDLKK